MAVEEEFNPSSVFGHGTFTGPDPVKDHTQCTCLSVSHVQEFPTIMNTASNISKIRNGYVSQVGLGVDSHSMCVVYGHLSVCGDLPTSLFHVCLSLTHSPIFVVLAEGATIRACLLATPHVFRSRYYAPWAGGCHARRASL